MATSHSGFMKKTLTLILLLFSLLTCMAQGRDGSKIMQYIRTAMNFNRAYPQEKVYLHLDNTGYFKGETIWFKAYVRRVDTDNRTDLSHVLYVELLSPSGDIVERRKLPIENGMAHGDIRTDSIMTTGFYEIRAYTRYMTNWGTNACFSRVIPVFKTPKVEGDYSSPTIDKISYRHRVNNERLSTNEANGSAKGINSDGKVNTNPKAQFFPEGGNIVKGLPCRIAVSIPECPSERFDIADEQGNVIDSFFVDSVGRGSFRLDGISAADRIVASSRDGKKASYKLPVPMQEGCTMMLDMLDRDRLSVDVYASEGLQGQKLGYVMMNRGTIVRCDTLSAQEHFSFSFKRSRLPDGVSQITLFDSYGQVVAERQFFILGTDDGSSHISISQASTNIKPCGKVTLGIHAAPNSSLSFSAIDASTMVNGKEENFKTWTLLSSEIKGYVRNPEYYFESDDEEHRKAADLLMLVQGWRKYDWELVSGQKAFDKFQPIEDRLYLYGRIKGKKKSQRVDNVLLSAKLHSSKGGLLEGEFRTDSVGRYAFVIPDIEDEWNLQIRSTIDGEDKNYAICIDRNFSPKARFIYADETAVIPVDKQKLSQWNYDQHADSILLNAYSNKRVLKNVTVKAKKRVWDTNGWESEKDAQILSMIYYDCYADLDAIADEGHAVPTAAEWLKSKNSFFAGNDPAIDVLLLKKGEKGLGEADTVAAIYEWFKPESTEYLEYGLMPPVPWKKLYADGLTYKNRPIVWIIDNMFVTVTGFKMRTKYMPVHLVYSDNNSNSMDLPNSLDELKCVYISENTRSMLSHIRCEEVDAMDPVVLYCYTNRHLKSNVKGFRHTYFQGFNTPETFKMEDYTNLPPMEDFRRTLYWNPNVTTDKDGKARIEFFNNSSCTEMFISAEGLSEDGKVIVY